MVVTWHDRQSVAICRLCSKQSLLLGKNAVCSEKQTGRTADRQARFDFLLPFLSRKNNAWISVRSLLEEAGPRDGHDRSKPAI